MYSTQNLFTIVKPFEDGQEEGIKRYKVERSRVNGSGGYTLIIAVTSLHH